MARQPDAEVPQADAAVLQGVPRPVDGLLVHEPEAPGGLARRPVPVVSSRFDCCSHRPPVCVQPGTTERNRRSINARH
jgi:hypothetical protein